MTYPKRYDLLDKNGKTLGLGVRWRKYQRIKFSLPFVEAARWFAGGRIVRLRSGITKRAPDRVVRTAKSDEATNDER